MSTNVAESVDDLLDDMVDVNQPLSWEFLGAGGAETTRWDRWASYHPGQCVRLPSGEVWCSKRTISPGGVGPGEHGWAASWQRLNDNVIGADSAAERAANERFSSRGGNPLGALVQSYHQIEDGSLGYASDATREILTRARDERPVDDVAPEVIPYDDLDIDIAPVSLEILGGAADAFPVTRAIYEKFKNKDTKFIRLDTEQTYLGLRDDCSDLRRKVDQLEALIADHMSDGHGRQDAIVGLASDVSNLWGRVERKRVPLQMPPWADGTWSCWREDGPDGGIVCCSISLPGKSGEVRICTTAAPVKDYANEVVRHTQGSGKDVPTLLGVLPTIACMLAGRDLMVQAASAAPAILNRPEAEGDSPFVGRIVTGGNPTRATMMELLQLAQAGDEQAANEWSALSNIAECGNDDLFATMSEAKGRLLAAQGVV